MNLHLTGQRTLTVTLLMSAMLLISCGKHKGGLPQSNEFPFATVTTSSVDMQQVYPAVIQGKQDIEIRPKVSGFITRLCVDEGAAVKAGQVLFMIDDVQYRAAYNQAQAALQATQSALATAELTYKNKQELHSQNIIGDYDLQTAANNLATAKASLAQAQAALTSARDNLNYCRVTSPTAGVIGTMPYRVGSLVSSSIATPLTTVSNIDQMYVYFSVTEKDLLEMGRNSTSKDLAANFPEVKLQLADGEIYAHPGKVNMVSGVIDQTTGSVSVRADFSNPDHLLKSGGTGSIIIPSKAENAIVIPQNSTTEVQNKLFVYLLGNDNKVKYTEIKVSPQNDGVSYIVTEGLKAGDRYITTGLTKLTDGMEITPLTEEQYKKNVEEAEKLGSIQGNYKEMKKAFGM